MSMEAREAVERELQERLKGTSITSLWADDEGDDTLPLPVNMSSDSPPVHRDETSTINGIELPSAVSNTNFPNRRKPLFDLQNSSSSPLYPQQQQQHHQQQQQHYHHQQRPSRLISEYSVGAKTAAELEELITRHITVRVTSDATAETIKVKLPRRS